MPFGIAQIGKAFRNEINPRNFTFRSREFEQMELEVLLPSVGARQWFEYWVEERLRFHRDLGFARGLPAHPPACAREELAHYARAAFDIEYRFPFGWQEIEGIHDRGDWDLTRHGEYSGKDLAVTDPENEGALRADRDRDLGRDRSRLPGAARERLRGAVPRAPSMRMSPPSR